MTSVDYDLHGTVGVRLVDAGPAEAAAVDRQLGPIRGPLPDAPVISVRFVDRLPVGELQLLGIREAGFDADRFVVLRGSHKMPVRVAIPMDQIGGSLEILAERGLPAVPLLVPILNLTALAQGILPIHAAAFAWRGRGVLVTGWSKGGKTETLLSFLRHGAAYVGDEWIYLRPDGTMHGIPEPLRLWRWHLDQLPDIRVRLRATDRLRLAALAALHDAAALAGRRLRPARRAAGLLRGQVHVDAAPAHVAAAQAASIGNVHLDPVCLVGAWVRDAVSLRTISAAEVAARMVHSLAYERRELRARSFEFRFGLPEARCIAVEDAGRREAERLSELLRDVPAVALDHPYPVDIDALFRELAPRVEAA